MALTSPSTVSCKLPLGSPQVPIACLIDALFAKGYIRRLGVVAHSRQSGLFFDCRHLPGGRPYLQAVLASEHIFSKGTKSFKSNQSMAWYLLLLASPTAIGKLSGKESKDALKLVQGEQVIPALANVPVGLIASTDDRPPVLRICDDAEIDGDEGIPFAIEDCKPSSSSSSSSSSSPTSHDDADIDGDCGGDAVQVFIPEVIDGVRCRMEKHKGSRDEGLRVTCPKHVDCQKFRSLRRDLSRYGPKASAFFLGAWLAGKDLHDQDHSKWRPNSQEIRDYILRQS
jgi:hypothetical protein